MKYIFKILILVIFVINAQIAKAQIGEIKDLATGAADIFSGCSAADVSAGCNLFSSCWQGGYVFIDFLADHHQEILNLRNLDPCLLSLDIDMNLAYSVHYSSNPGHYYNYINYPRNNRRFCYFFSNLYPRKPQFITR